MLRYQNNIQEAKEEARWCKMTKEIQGKISSRSSGERTVWNSVTHSAIKENHTNECEKWLDNFMMRCRKSVQSVDA